MNTRTPKHDANESIYYNKMYEGIIIQVLEKYLYYLNDSKIPCLSQSATKIFTNKKCNILRKNRTFRFLTIQSKNVTTKNLQYCDISVKKIFAILTAPIF